MSNNIADNPEDRLKIAILVRRFITTGGMERYVVESARRLALKHEVHVFAHEWTWRGDESITFHKIPKYLTKPNFLNLLLFSYLTGRSLDDSFDIVHSHERVTHFDVLTVHCPCFRTYITDEKKSWKRFFRWVNVFLSPRKMAHLWLEKKQFTYKENRMFIAVSSKVKENVQKNYPLPDESFGFAYPGVDRSLISGDKQGDNRAVKRAELGISMDDFVILFVGNEFKRKGLDLLLKGFSIIKGPGLKLVIAGGDDQKPYRRLAKKLGIDDNIIFLGLVEDMGEIYPISDIYILPTLSEPAGMAPIEAMAAGLPTIISNSKYAGSAEKIKQSEAILLDNPKDTNEIAESIDRLRDDDIRIKIGHRGRELAREFTWEKTTKETLDVYYDIIKRKGRTVA